MASSTPLRLCSLRCCAWAIIPAVLRCQVVSLMKPLTDCGVDAASTPRRSTGVRTCPSSQRHDIV
jgi:hypothetical protein